MIDIPLKGGRFHRVNSWDVQTYQATYKGIDVEREFKKMREWCLANPRRCKTESGIKRFIVTWLTKAKPEEVAPQSAYRDRVDEQFERELRSRKPADPKIAKNALREARKVLGMRIEGEMV